MMNIYVKLYGGLGNQLFQYAFGKSLSKKLSANLMFEIESGFKNDIFKREYALGDLGLNPNIISNFDEVSQLTVSTSLLGKLYRRLNLYLPESSQFYYRERKKFWFDEDTLKIKNDTFFEGYWQNYNYFKDIISDIRLEINNGYCYKNDHVTNLLNNKNTVAVHMRYPHAFVDGKVHKGTKTHFCSLDFNYFKKAIYEMKSRVPDPFFCFFSDNIEWAKKEIHHANLGIEYEFIDTENAISDFQLMHQCNHFVISNSTFSWWAAYLANRPNKQVVSPKNWINEVDFVAMDFFPADWHLISN